MPFKVCKETQLQTFQYKIVHRIVGCNHWLYNIKVKGSPDCELCNEDDTIIHYFIGCNGLEQFWESFMVWWKSITECNIILNEFIVLFGTNTPTRESEIFNYCIITATALFASICYARVHPILDRVHLVKTMCDWAQFLV